MSTYQFAPGHDNEAGLADVDPQPSSEGITYPEELFAISGLAYDDGQAMTTWAFGPELSSGLYVALLTDFGLTVAKYARCTVKTTGHQNRDFVVRNATIVRPNPRYEMGFYHDVAFTLLALEALT